MSPGFVHLRLHTEFSLVDGLVRVGDLIKSLPQLGMPACAVTDQSNLFGMVKFYKAARAAGIKPLIGADLWVAPLVSGEGPVRLSLLCMNLDGYRNLARLMSRAWQEGQQGGLPVLDRAWFDGATDGLIALSGGREGDIGRALLAGNDVSAAEALAFWHRHFPDRYYLEVTRTGREHEEACLVATVNFAATTRTPVVATNDVRFLRRDDFEAHEARVCIQESRTLDDPRRPRRYSEQQYLRSASEMAELFADLPEAIENTVEIARRCTLSLTLGQSVLPDFPVPAGMTTAEFFREQAREGLERRFETLLGDDPLGERRRTYLDRLEIELAVICEMGFEGYFLIVADFIRWARENDVPVGPGRGSGAGSLVAYALGITDLDPLPYDLLFERFLNPERVSMPDFDIDFCMEGRDRVIDYVARKYGRDRVAQIITYGTMAARAVVRDVGRVLGQPYGFVDRIAKLIPFKPGANVTLAMALGEDPSKDTQEFFSPDLKKLYDEDESVRAILDLARKLEGLARNAGKHAGGVVIAPTVLTDFSPLYCEPGGQGAVTQFDKDDVEKVGLVKFDFLGLRTLTIIDRAVKRINARGGEVDIARIPLDDPATFTLLKRQETTAVFQLESRGMKELIKRLQPDSFEDIVALVALYRPGPLQSGMVDDFIDRKHGRARVEYPHPALEAILKPTYGVILYQEQVMQIAQVLAGYTLGGADLLRRAMGKKKPEEMAKQREIFMSGATARGVEGNVASHIFDLMEKFAGYGFNKSHSAAYALLSYQTAWLKTHYPAAFMAAVLSSDMDKTDKVVNFIDECRAMGLDIQPPDINRSGFDFTVIDERTILYGLGAIKGVGQGAIESVVENRHEAGPFDALDDFCRRIDSQKLNRRVIEAMIRAGSLDALGPNRATLMHRLPECLSCAEQGRRDETVGQSDLFGGPALVQEAAVVTSVIAEWDDETRLAGEKETLGLYLTGHPIARYRDELRTMGAKRLADIITEHGDGGGQGGGYGRRNEQVVLAAGLVMDIRTRNMQSGRMGFLTLDDGSGRIEVGVFSEEFRQYGNLIASDRLLVVEGTVGIDEYTGGFRMRARRIFDMTQARTQFARRLEIALDAEHLRGGVVPRLKEVIAAFREGQCPVLMHVETGQARADIRLDASWNVLVADELLARLRGMLGDDRVSVRY